MNSINISIEFFPDILSKKRKILYFLKKIKKYNIKKSSMTFSNFSRFSDTLRNSNFLSKLGVKVTLHFNCKCNCYYYYKLSNLLINNKIFNLILLKGDSNKNVFINKYFFIKKFNLFTSYYPEYHRLSLSYFYENIYNIKKSLKFKNHYLQQSLDFYSYINVINCKIRNFIIGFFILKNFSILKKIFFNCSINIPKWFFYKSIFLPNCNFLLFYMKFIFYFIKNLNFYFKRIHFYTMNDLKLSYVYLKVFFK
ncbi:hypothetical protein [Candidatus Vidania fulgoroideorum]